MAKPKRCGDCQEYEARQLDQGLCPHEGWVPVDKPACKDFVYPKVRKLWGSLFIEMAHRPNRWLSARRRRR